MTLAAIPKNQRVAEAIGLFLEAMEETAKTLIELPKPLPEDGISEKFAHLSEICNGQFSVPHNTYRILSEAAATLLEILNLGQCFSQNTAEMAIQRAINETLRRSTTISKHAVSKLAEDFLKETKPDNGTYFFGVDMSELALETNMQFGPVHLMSNKHFKQRYESLLDQDMEVSQEGDFHVQFKQNWENTFFEFDHFLAINVQNHEETEAWKTARIGAEYYLNWLRMAFGYRAGEGIRLSSITRKTADTSKLFFSEEKGLKRSYGTGMRTAIIRDNALDEFANSLSSSIAFYAGPLAAWVSGKHGTDPIISRIMYASNLLAESYSEQSNAIRLVQFISALETLELMSQGTAKKAETLAKSCARLVALVDEEKRGDVHTAVFNAYKTRNDIVHGDMPSAPKCLIDFLRVEKFILSIFSGYLSDYATVRNSNKPQSTKHLRRLLRAMRKQPSEA